MVVTISEPSRCRSSGGLGHYNHNAMRATAMVHVHVVHDDDVVRPREPIKQGKVAFCFACFAFAVEDEDSKSTWQAFLVGLSN